MAVCRFDANSDVYVYYDVNGGICCCGCQLNDREIVLLKDEQEMIAHLERHRQAGHRVPDEALQELADGRLHI